MITLVDKLWLCWRILRGELVQYRADFESLDVTLSFRGKDRAELNRRLSGTRRRR